MTKVVVTEEMVERAIVAANWGRGPTTSQHFRHILEAALNPPPEQEIEVTYDMMCAGMNADGLNGFEKIPDRDSGMFVAKIYRSMRRLAPDFNKGPAEPQAADAPVQVGPLRFESTNPDKSASPYRQYGNTFWYEGLKND